MEENPTLEMFNLQQESAKTKRLYKCPICRKKCEYKGVCVACQMTLAYRPLIYSYHNELEKKRKYKRGEPITTIDELLTLPLLYWNNHIWNIKAFSNQQLSLILRLLNEKQLFKAIKKEAHE